MKFASLSLVAVVVTLLLAGPLRGADPDLRIEKAPTTNPWTHLELHNQPGNFQFVIVADRTGGNRGGVFEDAVRKINLLRPEFVMSVGDLIQGYTRKPEEFRAQWDEFQSLVAGLKMPFFYVPGNHDITNELMAAEWERRFGRSYYHFVYRNVLFLCLNTEDPPQSQISRKQIDYVRRALADNPDVRWTLVFMHKPLWLIEERNAGTPEEEAATGWLDVDAALRSDGRPYTVFAGHTHNYMKFERQDRRYIILATTGGGSRLRGTHFGEFDHVAWITMTDEGPLMANLMLDGIWDENVTTEKSRALANALSNAARIVAEPLYPEQEPFAGGTVPLRLTNDADLPLKISGRFRPSDRLRPDPYAIETVVAPNSVEIVDLKVQTLGEPVDVDGGAPLMLDLSLSYAIPDGPALEMTRVLSVAADQVLPVPRRTEPVVVDGRLDEWRAFPHGTADSPQIRGDSASWQGPGDASFRFAVAHDEEFLYVAVDATDEQVVPPADLERPWLQDGVEIRVDARPDPARSQNRGLNEIADFLFIATGPGETAEQTWIYPDRQRQLPQGVRAVSLKTEKGFAAEVAIPVQYLDEAQRQQWKRFRLNIFQNDRDEPGGPHAHVNWRPDWRSDETYAGSGTFERQ